MAKKEVIVGVIGHTTHGTDPSFAATKMLKQTKKDWEHKEILAYHLSLLPPGTTLSPEEAETILKKWSDPNV